MTIGELLDKLATMADFNNMPDGEKFAALLNDYDLELSDPVIEANMSCALKFAALLNGRAPGQIELALTRDNFRALARLYRLKGRDWVVPVDVRDSAPDR